MEQERGVIRRAAGKARRLISRKKKYKKFSRGPKTKEKLRAAFHEVKHDEPRIVAHTRGKFGEEQARKQKIAIALSKARKAGARTR